MKQQRKREREQKGSDAVKHAEDSGQPRLRPRASAYKTECARRSLTFLPRVAQWIKFSRSCACTAGCEPRAVREVSAICVASPDCDWGKNAQVKSHICAIGRWCCRSGRSLSASANENVVGRPVPGVSPTGAPSSRMTILTDPAKLTKRIRDAMAIGLTPAAAGTAGHPFTTLAASAEGSIEPVSKNPWRRPGSCS